MNLLWLHRLNTTLLNTDDHHRLAWDYDYGMAFGSDYSNDGRHGSRPGWILPTVARRLDRGEVHEQELLEQWKSYTENHTELPNVSQDDELRPELAKILAQASYRIHELFKWHNGTALTFGERDDQVFDTYRCLDFKSHTYPWESEAPWSVYEPNVGLAENPTYWSANESGNNHQDHDQGSTCKCVTPRLIKPQNTTIVMAIVQTLVDGMTQTTIAEPSTEPYGVGYLAMCS